MRKSFASWKSRSVSSGKRRSSSQRAARSLSRGSSASAFSQIPVKNLLPLPYQHAGPLPDVLVELLEIADAVRHAADVGMDAERHHARRFLSLRIQPVEVVDAATQPFLRRMVLQHHHRYVVHLDGVG